MAVGHRVHRRAVRQAMASATPPARKVAEREAPALGPWTKLIRTWLVADREAPPKQRHTARRVHQRLVAEYGANLAESTVRAYVARLNLELDNSLRSVTVPQTHGPGEEAEVDFGEFMAFIDGVAVLDVLHAPVALGAGFPGGVLPPGPGSVLRGPRGCLRALRGRGRIRYDNLKAAVAKVLRGRDRRENERFVALKSHFGFDIASPASTGPMRRAAWRVRWAGSAGATSSRCPGWLPWEISTSCSPTPM